MRRRHTKLHRLGAPYMRKKSWQETPTIRCSTAGRPGSHNPNLVANQAQEDEPVEAGLMSRWGHLTTLQSYIILTHLVWHDHDAPSILLDKTFTVRGYISVDLLHGWCWKLGTRTSMPDRALTPSHLWHGQPPAHIVHPVPHTCAPVPLPLHSGHNIKHPPRLVSHSRPCLSINGPSAIPHVFTSVCPLPFHCLASRFALFELYGI